MNHAETPSEDVKLLMPLWDTALKKWRALPGNEADRVGRFAQPWRMIYTALCFDGEVQNGGFHQFFWNSEGQRNPATLADLELIGATDFLRLFKRAVACSTEFEVVETKLRSGGDLEKFTAGYKAIPWDSFDTAYYGASPTVFQHVARYVREHPSEFT